MSETGKRIKLLESECQNLADKVQANSDTAQRALEKIEDLCRSQEEANQDVKELLKVFNAARGAIIFAKWLAGLTAIFGSAYIAIMKVKGS